MTPRAEWVEHACACGFRLPRMPPEVLDQVPRCLGCGRSRRAPPPVPARVRAPAAVDVSDLR